MATKPVPTTNGAFVPIGLQEPILRRDSREISLLVADENLSLTYAGRAAGERVTDPHVHQHTEALYVLEGELTFQLGAEREQITIGAGGFVAAPPASRTRSGPPAASRHAGSSSTPATAASPPSCAASATASTSSGTSQRSPETAASPQTTRSSAAHRPSHHLSQIGSTSLPRKANDNPPHSIDPRKNHRLGQRPSPDPVGTVTDRGVADAARRSGAA
jgi:mannose-6-phosphate isomerase-like protein (cupin superfamily)